MQIEQSYPKFDEWVNGRIQEAEVWSNINPTYLYE